MKLTVYRYADISTTHITRRDSELLTKHSQHPAPGTPIVYDYEYGFFIPVTMDWIDEDDVWDEISAQWRQWGYSEAFIELYEMCLDCDLPMLRLDKDGDVAKDLPQFDW